MDYRQNRLGLFGAVVFFALLGAVPSHAAAQEVGVVNDARGDVSVERAGKRMASTSGFGLQAGDRLRTGEDGHMRVALQSGGELELGPKSDMALLEHKAERTRLQLFLGSLWSKVSTALGPADYEVQTPNAVAGVRGTVFDVRVSDSGETEVAVSEGKVQFRSQRSGESMSVGPGQRAKVDVHGKLGQANVGNTPDNGKGGKKEDVPDSQKIASARAVVARLKTAANALGQLATQAQQEKDVVRLNCLQEKLFNVKSLAQIAETASVRLEEAITHHDNEVAAHEFDKLTIADQKVAQFVAAAQTCVGETVNYSGETSVEVDTDPSIIGSGDQPNPPINPVLPENITRPPSASPF